MCGRGVGERGFSFIRSEDLGAADSYFPSTFGWLSHSFTSSCAAGLVLQCTFKFTTTDVNGNPLQLQRQRQLATLARRSIGFVFRVALPAFDARYSVICGKRSL